MKVTTGNPFYRERQISTSLRTAVPSCVFDLDATKLASYSGSGQIWSNLVPTPADGASRGDYDFYLGAANSASSDDPAFNGTSGSPAAYFLNDGGDRFTLIGNNTTFLNNLHKTTPTTPFWIATAFRAMDGGSRSLFATNSSGLSLPGLRMILTSGEAVALQQGDGTTGKITTGNATATVDIDTLAIVAFNGTTYRYWVNSRTKTDVAYTYNTVTADANNKLALFLSAPAGERLYAMAMGNAFIDDVDAVKIIAAMNARHGRVYA